MTLMEEVKLLDEKLQVIDMPFDLELPIFQNLLWEIANRYNTTGQEVLRLYFEMKSTEQKTQQ